MKYKHYFAVITAVAFLLTGCQHTQIAAPEQNGISQTTAPEQDSTTQTLTEIQPPTTDNTPLSNIVQSDQIKLPDDILSFIQAERTEDGFGCIAYNLHRQLTYLYQY